MADRSNFVHSKEHRYAKTSIVWWRHSSCLRSRQAENWASPAYVQRGRLVAAGGALATAWHHVGMEHAAVPYEQARPTRTIESRPVQSLRPGQQQPAQRPESATFHAVRVSCPGTAQQKGGHKAALRKGHCTQACMVATGVPHLTSGREVAEEAFGMGPQHPGTPTAHHKDAPGHEAVAAHVALQLRPLLRTAVVLPHLQEPNTFAAPPAFSALSTCFLYTVVLCRTTYGALVCMRIALGCVGMPGRLASHMCLLLAGSKAVPLSRPQPPRRQGYAPRS